MHETIIDRRIVRGATGIADFVMEHEAYLRNGCTVDFATDNRMTDECDLDAFKDGCFEWAGIKLLVSPMNAEYDVLYIDIWGGGGCPQVATLDESSDTLFLAEAINDVVECDSGSRFHSDERIYVECVLRI